jgi:hypothetical protein
VAYLRGFGSERGLVFDLAAVHHTSLRSIEGSASVNREGVVPHDQISRVPVVGVEPVGLGDVSFQPAE